MQTKGGKNRCHLLGLWRPCMGNCAGTDFLSKKVRFTGRTARVRPVPPYCSCTFPHYFSALNFLQSGCCDKKLLESITPISLVALLENAFDQSTTDVAYDR